MKGILFKPNLVAAINNGRKTQTRRVIKGINDVPDSDMEDGRVQHFLIVSQAEYKKDEVIFIKEGFRFSEDLDHKKPSEVEVSPIEYKTGGTAGTIFDCLENPGKWRSKMFLPARFGRKFIKVNNVRVERLHDISEEDAVNEGVDNGDLPFNLFYKNYQKKDSYFIRAISSFFSLWKSINGEESWAENPWVFVYEFVKCDKNGKEIKA